MEELLIASGIIILVILKQQYDKSLKDPILLTIKSVTVRKVGVWKVSLTNLVPFFNQQDIYQKYTANLYISWSLMNMVN